MGFLSKEKTPAQIIVQDVCKVKKNEKVLIIANPETNLIAQDIFAASNEQGAKTTLLFQTAKKSMDYAEETVIAAIKSEPDVCFSISANKLGKDAFGIENPYTDANGKTYDNIFDYLLTGKKNMRAVWTPGITEDMFSRAVNIDYKKLAERCKILCEKYENAVSVHVTSPNGTDITVGLKGRKAMEDNGDFSQAGTGGNIPAGEVFISPIVGTSQGTIVFDGSMTFSDGDLLLKNPITVKVEQGFVSDIKGGDEAKKLLKDILIAEKEPKAMELLGKLPKGQGNVYSKNARNIGELGIGLNPAANITGNMLEDEKAFKTCHFAIGENYDGDAPSLIHFDGVVRNPTITIKYEDGSEFTVLDKGDLQI